MFEKLFSSIGIGSSKVNTILFDNIVERGKEVKGEVHIYGGKAEQTISEIYIHIDTEFNKDDMDMTEFRHITEPILEIKITDPIVIQPNEERVIPFSFVLPYYAPITFNEQRIHIQTELDINFFTHPVEDHYFIVKDPILEELFAFFNKHGFTHTNKSGLCRHKFPTDTNPTHCMQAFHLINNQGGKIYFVGNDSQIDIYVSDNDHISHLSIQRDEDLTKQLQKLPNMIKNKA
ncbi:putative SpoOM-related protein [Halalkalibacter wakoensis JCM 9140]|uniref:Putative SpoOM-related protein n=1 Tax=Halalkalibacter wakoensis JCM 9140 TaxID=1236970 RepID=W4Q999_9BACI|nr:sporulation protein [Halalkalibacter wakoensis]GAE27954.1 putative SpoOM-related protein [Halalkalibacter wakoensis JCM 9140]